MDSNSEIKFNEALKLFLNTCELKFNYWFEKSILPVYITKGANGVTGALINKTFENFQTDVKACLNPKIFESLLKNYFSDKRAIDVFLKQFFNTRINAYEIKNVKNHFNLNNLTSTI